MRHKMTFSLSYGAVATTLISKAAKSNAPCNNPSQIINQLNKERCYSGVMMVHGNKDETCGNLCNTSEDSNTQAKRSVDTSIQPS